ncbi:MAG: phosphoribosyl-ATP diphosphatase [Gemmatimonadetes bacterium]|nr:phosphoribosyl-ATP diphosphatase [Gemmatimonadota bacterium]
MLDVSQVNFEKGGGLATVVAQDARTGAVLMVAHTDREALERTISSGEMHYRSRSRGPWHKGATSGNTQRVVSLSLDCDGDAILARVEPRGPACHTGSVSCFGPDALDVEELSRLAATIDARAAEQGSDGYTRKLLADRNLRLKKLGEETAELVVALSDRDTARAAEEGADLFYHVLVALRAEGVTLGDVRAVLAARSAKAGR